MKLWSSLLLINTLLVSGVSVAQDAASDGLAVAKARKERDLGWQDSSAQLQMVLRNAQGQESRRALRIQTLEVAEDGDKGLTIFDEPLDVKGTAFLNYAHVDGADEQWLFLPAVKRVKRIASQNKSGPFMGSEFAYEDLSSFELGKYQFSLLREEQFAGQAVYVLQQIPNDPYSGYSKQLVWLDKQHYRPLQVEFYDRKQALLKTLTLGDYQLYLDKYWRAHKLVMVNHQTKKSTELLTEQLQFALGLSEADFNQASLRRAR